MKIWGIIQEETLRPEGVSAVTYRAKVKLILSGLLLAVFMTAAAAAIKLGGISALFTKADSLQPAFIIREYNGTVCVFHSKYSEIPAIVTEISFERLGESDKALLSDGIKACTREEVLKYLEDFGS